MASCCSDASYLLLSPPSTGSCQSPCLFPTSVSSFASLFPFALLWLTADLQATTCLSLCALLCPVWDASPTLADSSHMMTEMGGQQIQSLCLGCGDVSLRQFTITMSLSLKMCCYPPPRLKWFMGESQITVFQLRFVGAMPVFLSSDVCMCLSRLWSSWTLILSICDKVYLTRHVWKTDCDPKLSASWMWILTFFFRKG